MALSPEQKFTVIRLLGWPAATLVPGDMSYSKIISDKLDRFPEGAEPQLLPLLTKYATLETKIDTSTTRAGLKRLDDIEFFGSEGGSSEMTVLLKERKRIVREIASLLDIAIGPGARGCSMGNISI